MQTNQFIDIERRGSIALVGLNRPEQLNALHEPLRQELMHALDDLASDESVRVAVLFGHGERAFAAGADVAEFAARSVEEQRSVYARRRVYEAVAEFPKPLIAALHGHCYGGGAELAMACDARVADTSLRFGQFEVRLGLMPSAGGTQRLARLVGVGQAFRLVASGEAIDGAEAHRIGIVQVLAAPGEHVARAVELAQQIARWSPQALVRIKRSLRESLEMPLSEGIALEKELFLDLFATHDAREGIAAFVARRDPKFTGT